MSVPFTIKNTRYLFRYVSSHTEFDFIEKNRIIYSMNPMGTYWTTLITEDPLEAKRLLALPKIPHYRVGGISLADLDIRMVKRFDTASPAYNEPGGGEEILIEGAIPIVSIYDFNAQNSVYSFLSK